MNCWKTNVLSAKAAMSASKAYLRNDPYLEWLKGLLGRHCWRLALTTLRKARLNTQKLFPGERKAPAKKMTKKTRLCKMWACTAKNLSWGRPAWFRLQSVHQSVPVNERTYPALQITAPWHQCYKEQDTCKSFGLKFRPVAGLRSQQKHYQRQGDY